MNGVYTIFLLVILLWVNLKAKTVQLNETFIDDLSSKSSMLPPLTYSKRYLSRYWLQIMHDSSSHKLAPGVDVPLKYPIQWDKPTKLIIQLFQRFNQKIGHAVVRPTKIALRRDGNYLVEIAKHPKFDLANFYQPDVYPEPKRRYYLIVNPTATKHRVYGINQPQIKKHINQKFRCHGVPKHLNSIFPLTCMIHGGFWDKPCDNDNDCPYWDGTSNGCIRKHSEQGFGFCQLPGNIKPFTYHYPQP